MLDLWNHGTKLRRSSTFAAEQGLPVFRAVLAEQRQAPQLRSSSRTSRYQAFVDKLIALRKARAARINGTPKLLETLLRFEEFKCYPTMFPRVYPNGDVFYPCEVLRKIAGNVLEEGSISKCFQRGRELYGETPQCKNNCFLFGNVLSSYYVEDFWGFAGDTVRPR